MLDHEENEEQATPVSNDPVADQVSWRSLHRSRGETKYSHFVVEGDKLIVKRAKNYYAGLVVGALFLLVFYSMLFRFCVSFIQNNSTTGILVAVFAVTFFLSIVIRRIRGMSKPFTFDRSSGRYYRGRCYRQDDTAKQDRQGQLNSVYALQIVGERFGCADDAKVIYELNLVFKDGGRAHVSDHTDLSAMQESAHTLGEFLGVPVWTRDTK